MPHIRHMEYNDLHDKDIGFAIFAGHFIHHQLATKICSIISLV